MRRKGIQGTVVCIYIYILMYRMYEKEGNTGNCKQILDRALQLSSNNPHWNSRLLFQV